MEFPPGRIRCAIVTGTMFFRAGERVLEVGASLIAYYIANLPSNIVAERQPLAGPASEKKANFIASCLSLTHDKVKILSLSIGTKRGIFKSKLENSKYGEIKHINEFSLSPSYPSLSRIISINLFMFWELLLIKRNSTIYIYHGPVLIPCLIIIKLLKNHNYTLQLEEIYYTNSDYSKYKRLILYFLEKMMFYLCNSFILSAVTMIKELPLGSKKICIAHGAYRNNLNNIGSIKPNNIPKFLFSGTIDYTRGAFFLLTDIEKLISKENISAEFHFTGTGKPHHLSFFNEISDRINANFSSNKYIYFHGLLEEKEYELLLSNVDYGLVFQDTENSFSSCCFPSKIIQYLNFGLDVLCPCMQSVVESKIAHLVTFYNANNFVNILKSVIINHNNAKRSKREKMIEMYRLYQELLTEI